MADKILGYEIILQQMIEALLEYSKSHKGQVEGLMAYDVLLTAQEQATALDIDLKNVGLTEEIVKSLL